MQSKNLLVYLLTLLSFTVKGQQDTIFGYIEKAESMAEKESRIINHGGKLLYNAPSRIPELAKYATALNKKLKSKRLDAAVYNLKGLYARQQGHLDSSVVFHKKSLHILRNLPPHIQLVREYNHLSITYHSQGKYDKYLAYNDSAIYLAETVADDDYKHLLLNNRAYILLQLGDTLATKKLLESLLPQMDDDPGLKAATCENLARIHSWQHRQDSALHYLDMALRLSEKAGEQRLKAQLLQQLGHVYFQQKKVLLAAQQWRESLEIFRRLGDVHGALYARAEMAYVLHEQGRTSEAVALLDSVLAESRNHGYDKMSSQLLQQKTEFYEEMGDHASALLAYKDMIALKDSVQGEEVKKQIAELETRYQAREREQELAVIKQDQALQSAKANQLYILFITLLIFLLLLSAYLRFYYRSKQKIAENDRARLHAEMAHRVLEEQKLKEEIELKSKQLTTKALSLSERNELLSRLLDKMRQARNGSDIQRNEMLKQAEREIAANLHNQSEWQEFNTYFEEINNGFTERLTSQYPQLSQRELRLLSLTKLGLTTKEISNLLHVAPDSVKMARYRLKKKLQLAEEETIEGFLTSLNGQFHHSEAQ